MSWKLLSEEPPEEDVPVLFWGEYTALGHLESDGRIWTTSGSVYALYNPVLTHWHPLPDPPSQST